MFTDSTFLSMYRAFRQEYSFMVSLRRFNECASNSLDPLISQTRIVIMNIN